MAFEVALNKKYKLSSSDNFDEFMKQLGKSRKFFEHSAIFLYVGRGMRGYIHVLKGMVNFGIVGFDLINQARVEGELQLFKLRIENPFSCVWRLIISKNNFFSSF